MTDALAQARKALEAIVDTLDAEEMGEGPPASQHVAHWQKLHEDAQSALAEGDEDGLHTLMTAYLDHAFAKRGAM